MLADSARLGIGREWEYLRLYVVMETVNNVLSLPISMDWLGFREQLTRCVYNAELEIGIYAGSMVNNIDWILTAGKTEQCSEVNKLIKV